MRNVLKSNNINGNMRIVKVKTGLTFVVTQKPNGIHANKELF